MQKKQIDDIGSKLSQTLPGLCQNRSKFCGYLGVVAEKVGASNRRQMQLRQHLVIKFIQF